MFEVPHVVTVQAAYLLPHFNDEVDEEAESWLRGAAAAIVAQLNRETATNQHNSVWEVPLDGLGVFHIRLTAYNPVAGPEQTVQ